MIKAEFSNLKECVDFAEGQGGWIFHSKDENISIWYDAAIYTMTKILLDTPYSGQIRPWSYFK